MKKKRGENQANEIGNAVEKELHINRFLKNVLVFEQTTKASGGMHLILYKCDIYNRFSE